MATWCSESIESEAPVWEPEPFELPLVEPMAPFRRMPLADEPSDPGHQVIVIDLL